jgi:FkbM family methyltransferase
MTNAEQLLEALLAESPEHAATRREQQLASLRLEQGVIIFGAGTLGRTTLNSLRAIGIQPVAFLDDTPEKQGGYLDGVPIYSIPQIAELNSQAIIVVAIVNPRLPFARAKEYLRQYTARPVFSYVQLSWKFARIPQYYQFELPEQTLGRIMRIRRAFDVLSDEESRQEYVTQLRFRLHLDYDQLPATTKGGYLACNVLPELPPDITFVDCGAFDGDSIREFLTQRGNRFLQIVAFEPDPDNFCRLRSYVNHQEPEITSKIVLHCAAVGERRGIGTFRATGDMGAAFDAAGEIIVPVFPLDEVIERTRTPVFVKMDVEGAEQLALVGARDFIRRSKPILAIATYHNPDDLWAIPLYLNDLTSDYDLFVRAQGTDGMDVFCYAVPRGAIKQSAAAP